MARTEIPIVVLDPATGEALSGATIEIRKRADGGLATIFSTEAGAGTLANPTAADAQGEVDGWLDRAGYNAFVTHPRLGSKTVPFESAPSSNGSVDLNWLTPQVFDPMADLLEEGVLVDADLKPTLSTNTVTVAAATRGVWIQDEPVGNLVRVKRAASGTVALASNAGNTLPRVDRVIASIGTGGFGGECVVSVLQGVPTAGASLDTPNGTPAVPDDSIHVADYPFAASAAAPTAGRDRRPFASAAATPVPQLKTATGDMVGLDPHPSLVRGDGSFIAAVDLVAALMYLPRRIVGATKVRLRLISDQVGTVNISIHAASGSGAKVAETGAFALSGPAGTTLSRAIAATTFEAGWYFVVFTISDAAVSGGTITRAYHCRASSNNDAPSLPNTALRRPGLSAGAVAPADLSGFSEIAQGTASNGVPIIGLSVA